MPNILLGVTGSVAAIRTPVIFERLIDRGYRVRIVATQAATYFFDPTVIGSQTASRNPEVVSLDEDEWPGRDSGTRYQRNDSVLHIELRRWADLFLIAPLDANTLAKLANGLCDNCLTSVWRAWDANRPVVLAPAMNTLMWQHPYTRRHLRTLGVDAGASHVPGHLDEMGIVQTINERSRVLQIVPPQVKNLACGDVGIGAMADIEEILAFVQKLLPSDTPPQGPSYGTTEPS